MAEQDFSNMIGGLLESVGDAAKSVPVEVLVEDSYTNDVQKLLEDRICGLLLQESLTPDQIALLSALMRGYKPCAR